MRSATLPPPAPGVKRYQRGGPVEDDSPAEKAALQTAGQYAGTRDVLTPENAPAYGLDPSKGYINPQFGVSQSAEPTPPFTVGGTALTGEARAKILKEPLPPEAPASPIEQQKQELQKAGALPGGKTAESEKPEDHGFEDVGKPDTSKQELQRVGALPGLQPGKDAEEHGFEDVKQQPFNAGKVWQGFQSIVLGTSQAGKPEEHGFEEVKPQAAQSTGPQAIQGPYGGLEGGGTSATTAPTPGQLSQADTLKLVDTFQPAANAQNQKSNPAPPPAQKAPQQDAGSAGDQAATQGDYSEIVNSQVAAMPKGGTYATDSKAFQQLSNAITTDAQGNLHVDTSGVNKGFCSGASYLNFCSTI